MVGPFAILQFHVDAPSVDRAAQPCADGAVGLLHARCGGDDGLQFHGLLFRGFQAGTGLGLEGYLQISAIKIGHEVVAQETRETHGQEEASEADGEHALAMGKAPGDDFLVELFPSVQHAPEGFRSPHDGVSALVMHMPIGALFVLWVRPHGTEHGVQCETNEKANRHRECDGDAEGEKEFAHDATHEGHRHEHREDGHGGGDDRGSDLGSAFPCRRDVVLAHFRVPRDVLAHHDGIVNQNADGETQAHERHGVQGEVQGSHDDEGGDHGNRQRKARDERRAP